jgi:hypothetical protein
MSPASRGRVPVHKRSTHRYTDTVGETFLHTEAALSLHD